MRTSHTNPVPGVETPAEETMALKNQVSKAPTPAGFRWDYTMNCWSLVLVTPVPGQKKENSSPTLQGPRRA